VSDYLERRMGAWIVRIDRHLCVGFGDCIDIAPELFELDDDGVARFPPAPPHPPDALLRAACSSCPVDALSLLDATGRQVVP
jgi:ferredoxin